MTNSEHIAAFTAFLRKADEWSRIAEADEKEAFAQRLDIEHRLELHDDDYRTTARLGKLLRQVNRRRRVAKNTAEALAPVLQWAAENRKALNALDQALGATRKIEEQQKSRVYTPRTDILQVIE